MAPRSLGQLIIAFWASGAFMLLLTQGEILTLLFRFARRQQLGIKRVYLFRFLALYVYPAASDVLVCSWLATPPGIFLFLFGVATSLKLPAMAGFPTNSSECLLLQVNSMCLPWPLGITRAVCSSSTRVTRTYSLTPSFLLSAIPLPPSLHHLCSLARLAYTHINL